MRTDIVTRLRKSENLLRLSEVRSINAVDVIQLSSDIHDAADEIERLRDQVAGYKFVVQLAIKLYETETPDAR